MNSGIWIRREIPWTAWRRKIELPETAIAPFAEGDTAGRAVYLLNGVEIGSVPILYENAVAKAVYKDYLRKIMEFYLL